MQTVRLLTAHFLNAALGRIADFVVYYGFQLLAHRFPLCCNIRGTEASILQERAGQYLAEKSKRLAKQALLALYKGVVDRIHPELDNLIITPFIDVKTESGPVQLLQPLTELCRFRICSGASAKDKGCKCR
ncbi:hypothetical protein D3C81_1407900 [compost metagenome]